MTDDLSYLGGFFDGEGSIGVFNGSLTVRVVNCYRPTLDKFQAKFGGTVSVHHKGTDRTRMTWVWRCNGATAEAALLRLHPYLREKQAQATVGLLYREHHAGPFRDSLVATLALLKRTTHHRSPKENT